MYKQIQNLASSIYISTYGVGSKPGATLENTANDILEAMKLAGYGGYTKEAAEDFVNQALRCANEMLANR